MSVRALLQIRQMKRQRRRLRKICAFGACQKKVINIKRHLQNRHKVPSEKVSNLATLCTLLTKYKEPSDVPTRLTVHYMKQPNSNISETVDESDISESQGVAGGDVIATHREQLVKATKELYTQVLERLPVRPSIPYREMIADEQITTASSETESDRASTSSLPPLPPITLLSNETKTERWLTYCEQCELILIWTRRFAHL